MKVLIVTDLEGVSGIVEWDRHERGTALDQWQRTLMTAEINAAVAGAYDAGADRVKVAAGHDAVDIMQLDQRATLVPGHFPSTPTLQGWDEGFDAQFQIGKHSMAGTADGVLAHSYNRNVEYVEINGVRIGEIGVEVAEAGEFGFGLAMISGDVAACREAEQLVGDVETAAVKTGYDCYHADCLQPLAACELIRQKAAAALKRVGDFKPLVIDGPIRMVQRGRLPFNAQAIERCSDNPALEVVDEFTVAFHGASVHETMARRCELSAIWTG